MILLFLHNTQVPFNMVHLSISSLRSSIDDICFGDNSRIILYIFPLSVVELGFHLATFPWPIIGIWGGGEAPSLILG